MHDMHDIFTYLFIYLFVYLFIYLFISSMQSNGAQGKNTLKVLNNKASQLNGRFPHST